MLAFENQRYKRAIIEYVKDFVRDIVDPDDRRSGHEVEGCAEAEARNGDPSNQSEHRRIHGGRRSNATVILGPGPPGPGLTSSAQYGGYHLLRSKRKQASDTTLTVDADDDSN